LIAVDTNILVYAHREESPFHDVARRQVAALAEGDAPWALPWPCVHEFFAIATHPRIYNPPTPVISALEQIETWLASPTVVLLAETLFHWKTMRELLASGDVVGPQVHDARIAALCLQHGVRELLSADRNFGKLDQLAVINPFA